MAAMLDLITLVSTFFVRVLDMWMPKLYLQIEPDKMEKIASFQAREDDIWLCSYPKSGSFIYVYCPW